jgi:hypothetical protein
MMLLLLNSSLLQVVLFLLQAHRRAAMTPSNQHPLLLDVLLLLQRPLVKAVELCRVRLGQVVLELVQVVPLLLLLLLLLLQVGVPPEVLAQLGCTMLGVALRQVEHTWLVVFLYGQLGGTVALGGSKHRTHEGVA